MHRRTSCLAALAGALLTLPACQKTAPESAPEKSASAGGVDRAAHGADAPSSARPAPPRAPITHVLVEADHLHLVDLAVGDAVELPHDDAFDWSVLRWQGDAVFEPAGGAGRYRAVKAGGNHLIVDGDPKCLKRPGGCGTSKREWTIFVIVH